MTDTTFVNHAIEASTIANATWALDAAHTTAQFSVRHLVSRVTGTFTAVDGQLRTGATDLIGGSVVLRLDAASVNTHSADRDAHLKSADFFLTAEHPHIVFESTSITKIDEGEYDVKGELEIRGVRKPVTLHVHDNGRAKDGWGNTRAGFTAAATINRHDFGVNWNMALEAGGMMLAEKVALTVDAQFVLQAAQN